MRSILKIGFLGIILVTTIYQVLSPRVSKTMAADVPSRPLWEIDLTKFGYQGRPPIHLGPELAWGTATYQQGVFFTEPNVITAFFVVHDNPSGVAAAADRKPLPSDPYRLVAVFLDAKRGELIRKLEWPLPSTAQSVSNAFFIPATKGRFIIGLGDTLSLYSPDFKVLAQHIAQTEISGVASPSGETVLLGDTRRLAGQWTEQFDLLETEGMSVLKTWKSLPQDNYILWGDEIARMTPQSISIETPDVAARPLVEGKQWFCGNWSFINGETIAMFQCGGAENRLAVVSTGGNVLYQFDLGLEQVDGPVVASRNGKRFAVPTNHWGSGRNKDPEKLIARVFGLDDDKPLLTLDVAPHYSSSPNFYTPNGDTRFGWGGLALSPDGERLAVKSGPLVQLYQLPEPGRSTPCSGNCASDAANPRPAQAQQEPDLSAPREHAAALQLAEQVLSWLPADTETVMAANGPFPLPDLSEEEKQPGTKEADDIGDTFKVFPLGLFGFNKGVLGKYFKDEKVLFALEGSRKFRNPSGLGEGPFQGCNIAVFSEDITAQANSFLTNASGTILRTEQIEGQQVAVFQEKLEEDLWTTFVAFPKPNIAIAATDEEYLREVLARINGKRGGRALPESLAEWKYVNRHAAFWAIRHYDKAGASTDPTSPFAGNASGLLADDQAIGLAFSFDPGISKTATIAFLSGDKNMLPKVQKRFAPVESETGAKEMHIRYREIAPGVVEGSYDLEHIESAEVFAFVLGALLGHAVAV